MAIKKISEFTSATPTASDKILFEQSGAGKSTTIGNAVNTCSLSLEEIQATTDLTGKVANASSVKGIDMKLQKVSKLVLSGTSNGQTVTFSNANYIDHLGIFSWHDTVTNKGGVIIVACGFTFIVIANAGHNGGSATIEGNIYGATVTTNSDNVFNWQYTVIGDCR